jgi:hypothetical protein
MPAGQHLKKSTREAQFRGAPLRHRKPLHFRGFLPVHQSLPQFPKTSVKCWSISSCGLCNRVSASPVRVSTLRWLPAPCFALFAFFVVTPQNTILLSEITVHVCEDLLDRDALVIRTSTAPFLVSLRFCVQMPPTCGCGSPHWAIAPRCISGLFALLPIPLSKSEKTIVKC